MVETVPSVFSMADSHCNAQQSIPGILCNLVELKKFTRYILSLALLTPSAIHNKVFQEYYVTW